MKSSILEKAQHLIKATFTENLRLKALAMVISGVIFISVRGGREATAYLTVELAVIRPTSADGKVLMTGVPEKVKLRVRGSPRVIQLASEDEIPTARIDLRSEEDGPYVFKTDFFRVPPGLEVEEVRPASLDLHFEPLIKRVVQVIPVIGGQVAINHHVKNPVTTDPTKVTLSGPQSVVRVQQKVQTELITVEGLGPGNFPRRIPLEQPPEKCSYDTYSVEVTLIVEPDLVERTLENIEVVPLGTGPIMTSSAETISIVLRGLPEVVERVRPGDITASVDLGNDGNTPGSYRREVQLEGLDNTIQVTIAPATVIVEVQRSAPPPVNPDASPVNPDAHPGP